MIRYFAAHPTAGNLLMVALMALGLIATGNVKRETFPDLPATDVQISVPYPGATAEEVEEAICQRIEDVVDSIDDLEEKRCEAREGSAIATLEMVESGDMKRFLDDIKTEVEAIDSFPDEAETPVIKQLGRTDFLATVAISGDTQPTDLKAYAEDVKDRVLLIPGVSQVRIKGFSEHQIRIEIAADTLRQFGLSVDQLAAVIGRQNVKLPSGTIETSQNTVLIRFDDERRRPLDFENLVVVGADSGAEIRLGDIATITDRFELDEEKINFNGQRAAFLSVDKGKEDDTLSVIEDLKSFVERERQIAPKGLTLTVTHDISSIVRDRLNMLLRNGSQGLGLVFLTMWLFFSLRFSFWVAMGLPVSFLGTIAAMAVFGYSFDMITLVGLLIAVGLLMDDAIVISENIVSHRKRGKSPLIAAVDGAREVAPGVISSFLTTICIFGGLAFLTGHIGNILKVLPVILIMTLAVSLIEAFLILPHHLKGSMSHSVFGDDPTGFRKHFETGIEWLRENLAGRLVDKAVGWRYLTVGITLALLLISVSMLAGGILKFRAFPDLEGNVMQARILLPQGTPLERTDRVVGKVVAAIKEIDADYTPRQPDGQNLVVNIGIEYATNADAFESGPHVATVSVDLLSSEIRNARMDEVLNQWRQKVGDLPDVLNLKFAERQLGPGGIAIDIRLLGKDLDVLKAASLDLQAWLNAYQGVFDLTDDLRPGKPEVRVRLRPGATGLGLTANDIAGQLRTAFQGRQADEIQVGPESYEIDVRLALSDRNSLADLEYFTITLPDGAQAPLNTVASLHTGRGYARIARVGGQRTVTLRGDVDTEVANVSEIIGDTTKRFLPDLEKRYPGITVNLQGQAKETAKTGDALKRNFLIGLLGVFLILSFQFRSYVEPLIVMVAIPLGVIGAVFGHLLMGIDMSMPSMVGLASLAGVVVNNSILLVRFIKIRVAEGHSIPEAACLASRQRFRAILLTSLTTVMGLLPLLTETSLQAQVMIPLVTSLAFGLFVATVLVLFTVPALYVILDDFGLATAKTAADEDQMEAGDADSPAVI